MRLKYMSLGLAVMLLVIPVLAQGQMTWHEYCCNDTYLCRDSTYSINGEVNNIHNYNPCQYGCADDQCIPRPQERSWEFLGVLAVIMIIAIAMTAYFKR